MLSKTNSSHLLTNYKMQFKNMRKRTVFNYINGHLGYENLLDQNSTATHTKQSNRWKREYRTTVRKYFTKQGWKALKALIIEKNYNLIWDCKICETDLHAKESIFCDYCLVWFHLKCTKIVFYCFYIIIYSMMINYMLCIWRNVYRSI
jgi:hypothetical protein